MNDKQIKSLLKKKEPGRFSVGNGLYFRVSREASGFWVLRYVIHKKRREMSLGRYPELSLADARDEAVKFRTSIKKGIDPLAERQRLEKREFKTVDDLARDWLEDCEKRLKHPKIPRRVYKKDIAPSIGALPIEQVNPRDIRAIIQKVTASGRPTVANDTLMYCKQLFRHGIKLDLLSSNPAEAFNVSDAGGIEKSRSRSLSLEELEKMFSCFRENKNQFTRENYLAVALLLCLGVRKGELIAARWEEFDFSKKLWNIPEARSKTGKAISIPLPNEAIEWLKELYIRSNGSKYVFPNRRKSKRFGHISPDTINAAIAKLLKQGKLAIPHFTVHDLRRSCRGLLASVGTPGHVAERCLNHALKGVEGIYDRYDYLEERREALEKVAGLVSPIVDKQEETNPFN